MNTTLFQLLVDHKFNLLLPLPLLGSLRFSVDHFRLGRMSKGIPFKKNVWRLLMRDLYWPDALPVNQRTASKHCQPVSGISGRRRLRSADRGHLDFPRVKLASYGGRSFAFAGPSNWNSLPAHLRDNSHSLSSFKRHLKTFLFSFY